MNGLWMVVISILATVFFSGTGIAFVSADQLRLGLDRGSHPISSRIIDLFLKKPNHFIAVMLTGGILSMVFFTLSLHNFVVAPAAGHLTYPYLILIGELLVFPVLYLAVAYFIPTVLFTLHPNASLYLFALPALIFYLVLFPLTWFTLSISRMILKYVPGSKASDRMEKLIFSRHDLHNLFREHWGSPADTSQQINSEMKLFRNAADFSRLKIRDCMIPRTEIVMMEVSEEIDALRQKFIETGYSRILICRENPDDIIGYVHSSDLFRHPENIASCLREIAFVPETMDASKLLSMLLKEHKSTAIVVDEFGGTAGMITTEDILEEIFGEIEDEHDTPDIIEKKLGENRYVFSGRAAISVLNEKYSLGIGEDDRYETLAGYLLFHHSNIPKHNTVLVIGSYQFKILRSTKTKIELVEMKKISNL